MLVKSMEIVGHIPEVAEQLAGTFRSLPDYREGWGKDDVWNAWINEGYAHAWCAEYGNRGPESDIPAYMPPRYFLDEDNHIVFVTPSAHRRIKCEPLTDDGLAIFTIEFDNDYTRGSIGAFSRIADDLKRHHE